MNNLYELVSIRNNSASKILAISIYMSTYASKLDMFLIRTPVPKFNAKMHGEILSYRELILASLQSLKTVRA